MTSDLKPAEAGLSAVSSRRSSLSTAAPSRHSSIVSQQSFEPGRRTDVRTVGFLKLRGLDDDLPQYAPFPFLVLW